MVHASGKLKMATLRSALNPSITRITRGIHHPTTTGIKAQREYPPCCQQSSCASDVRTQLVCTSASIAASVPGGGGKGVRERQCGSKLRCVGGLSLHWLHDCGYGELPPGTRRVRAGGSCLLGLALSAPLPGDFRPVCVCHAACSVRASAVHQHVQEGSAFG